MSGNTLQFTININGNAEAAEEMFSELSEYGKQTVLRQMEQRKI